MNTIVTSKPTFSPISLEQPPARPVTPIAADTSDTRDVAQQSSSNFVYRGELLEANFERSYRPQQNLQVDPENSRAISTYQKIVAQPPVVGTILDGFI